MAAKLTNKGQEYLLHGTATPNGGLTNLATAVRLYDNTSVPNKNGSGFVQVASGNGYPVGGTLITRASWALALNLGDQRITLADIVLTASGGNIPNIAGAYFVDAGGLVLAWWERGSSLTLGPGETLTLDDLSVKLIDA